MPFESDKPIRNHNEDLLSRTKYAQSIADAILNQDSSDSLTIGLYGIWGSGKTSTLNLVKEAIYQSSLDFKEMPIVISFSSWGCDSLEKLFNAFIQALRNEASLSVDSSEQIKSLLKELADYASLLSPIIPYVGLIQGFIQYWLKKRKKSLDDVKNKIEKTLRSHNRKYVVIIDDIDRLPDYQVKTVFQFISIAADFPNIIYILPFDYQVVSTALSGVQGLDGATYLHKIIQVPLTLPDPEPDLLIKALGNELDEIIDFERDDYLQQRLWEIRDCYLMPDLLTFRDLIRLKNVYRFQNSILGSELNSLDILALSSLIAFDPILYSWIKNNKALLLGLRYGESASQRKEQLEQSLMSTGYENAALDNAKNKLKCLFPALTSTANANRREMWRERRICHSDIFDLYFSSQRVSPLPSRSIGDAIAENDIEFLQKLADSAIRSGQFSFYLEELLSRVDTVKTALQAPIASMLLLRLGIDSSFDGSDFFGLSCDRKIGLLTQDLFKKLGQTTTYNVILDNLPKMNLNALASFAMMLNDEELAHGRLAGEEPEPDEQKLTENDLEAIEREFLSCVNNLSQSPQFLEHGGLYMLIYLWYCFDKDGCLAYWQNQFKTNQFAICYFISSMSARWSSSSGNYGWTFSKELMEPILPRDFAKYEICQLKANNKLQDLDAETLLKTILYYENGYSDFGNDDKWGVKQAQEVLPEWLNKND